MNGHGVLSCGYLQAFWDLYEKICPVGTKKTDRLRGVCPQSGPDMSVIVCHADLLGYHSSVQGR